MTEVGRGNTKIFSVVSAELARDTLPCTILGIQLYEDTGSVMTLQRSGTSSPLFPHVRTLHQGDLHVTWGCDSTAVVTLSSVRFESTQTLGNLSSPADCSVSGPSRRAQPKPSWASGRGAMRSPGCANRAAGPKFVGRTMRRSAAERTFSETSSGRRPSP